MRRFITGQNRAPVDCAVTPCVVFLEQGGVGETILTASISFDPNASASPLPTVNVTPNANLAFEPSVAISGEHFAAGELVRATQCTFGAPFDLCRDVIGLTADGAGAVAGTATLRRVIPDFTGTRYWHRLRGVDPDVWCGTERHQLRRRREYAHHL